MRAVIGVVLAAFLGLVAAPSLAMPQEPVAVAKVAKKHRAKIKRAKKRQARKFRRKHRSRRKTTRSIRRPAHS